MNKETILLQIEPKYIHFLNRIMEGYEYLGVVTTLNRQEGIVKIRVTPDTRVDVEEILSHLAVPIRYLEHLPGQA